MILTTAQADAILTAMAQLNNLGTMYLFAVEYPTYGVRAPVGGAITIKGGNDGFEIESYDNPAAFATAYNLR